MRRWGGPTDCTSESSTVFKKYSESQTCQKKPFPLTQTVMMERYHTHTQSERVTESERDRRGFWPLGVAGGTASQTEVSSCQETAILRLKHVKVNADERERQTERATGGERDKERSFAQKVCRESEREQERERATKQQFTPTHPSLQTRSIWQPAARVHLTCTSLSHTLAVYLSVGMSCTYINVLQCSFLPCKPWICRKHTSHTRMHILYCTVVMQRYASCATLMYLSMLNLYLIYH